MANARDRGVAGAVERRSGRRRPRSRYPWPRAAARRGAAQVLEGVLHASLGHRPGKLRGDGRRVARAARRGRQRHQHHRVEGLGVVGLAAAPRPPRFQSASKAGAGRSPERGGRGAPHALGGIGAGGLGQGVRAQPVGAERPAPDPTARCPPGRGPSPGPRLRVVHDHPSVGLAGRDHAGLAVEVPALRIVGDVPQDPAAAGPPVPRELPHQVHAIGVVAVGGDHGGPASDRARHEPASTLPWRTSEGAVRKTRPSSSRPVISGLVAEGLTSGRPRPRSRCRRSGSPRSWPRGQRGR